MPRWDISPIWKDKEVFIIGGGTSLRDFDWNILIPELTIGCNDAFRLGEQVCKICLFGDSSYFHNREKELEKFKGMVMTNHPRFNTQSPNWLLTIPRKPRGLHSDALGWNDNTGFAAINLAILLGASKIYLLGFDMKMAGGKHNWHDGRKDRSGGIVYQKFLKSVPYILKDKKNRFPNVEIYNITDDSELNAFPKIGTREFWESRVHKGELQCTLQQ